MSAPGGDAARQRARRGVRLRRASLAWALTATLVGSASHARADEGAPSAETAALAQQAFDRGLRALEGGDGLGALEAFRTSQRLVPSPNSGLMIARVLVELGRGAEAHEAYRETIVEAEARLDEEPRFAATLAHARAELETLETGLGWVRVVVDPEPSEGELQIGERVLPIDRSGVWIVVDPGPLAVEVRAPGRGTAHAEVELDAGARETVHLSLAALVPELAPAPRPDHTQRDVGIAALVAGGALAIAGSVLLGLAVASYEDLDGRCPASRCPAGFEQDVERGQAFEVSGWALVGTAGASLVLGAVLAGTLPGS